MRRGLMAAWLVLPCLLLTASCEDRNPVGPTSSETVDQFLQALRQQGLNVSVGGQISPSANGFFSVAAQEVRVNNAQVNVFAYRNAEAAAAEAASISADGQPSPTVRVTWVSTPHFYRRDALIALYVGCAPEIVQALQTTLGTPIAIGRTLCDGSR
jgi:hypothetical protein